jgi:LPXTG-site transpeptidase (sortase) family protein
MTVVLPGRASASGPAGEPVGEGASYLDDATRELLLALVDQPRNAQTSNSEAPVDWAAIWQMADGWSSEELALGSVVLAAEDALAGGIAATPSALLVRPGQDTLRAGGPIIKAGPIQQLPVDQQPIDSRLPKGFHAAVSGATWTRNVGIIIVLFAVWQLWGTGIAEAHSQSHLKAQYALLVNQETSGGTMPGDQATVTTGGAPVAAPKNTQNTPPVKVPTFAAAKPTGAPAAGGAAGAASFAQTRAFIEGALPGGVLGRIRIPAIGEDRYFVEGVGEDQLQEGPGRYPGSGLPGQSGNLAIAGHRTTYGAPFFELDHVRVGDKVIIDVPEGRAIYTVSRPPFAVSPYDTSVLANFGDSRLTLTTCNPPFFATTRLIVVADLTEWLPTGALIPIAPRDPEHVHHLTKSTIYQVSRVGDPTPLRAPRPKPATVQERAPSSHASTAPLATTGIVGDISGKEMGGAQRGEVNDVSTVNQGLANEGAGWHFAELPLVLAIVTALGVLGACYGRVARLFAGASRWLVMAPMWAAGLLALFKVLGLLLPSDL